MDSVTSLMPLWRMVPSVNARASDRWVFNIPLNDPLKASEL